jgi:hypothetical protein
MVRNITPCFHSITYINRTFLEDPDQVEYILDHIVESQSEANQNDSNKVTSANFTNLNFNNEAANFSSHTPAYVDPSQNHYNARSVSSSTLLSSLDLISKMKANILSIHSNQPDRNSNIREANIEENRPNMIDQTLPSESRYEKGEELAEQSSSSIRQGIPSNSVSRLSFRPDLVKKHEVSTLGDDFFSSAERRTSISGPQKSTGKAKVLTALRSSLPMVSTTASRSYVVSSKVVEAGNRGSANANSMPISSLAFLAAGNSKRVNEPSSSSSIEVEGKVTKQGRILPTSSLAHEPTAVSMHAASQNPLVTGSTPTGATDTISSIRSIEDSPPRSITRSESMQNASVEARTGARASVYYSPVSKHHTSSSLTRTSSKRSMMVDEAESRDFSAASVHLNVTETPPVPHFPLLRVLDNLRSKLHEDVVFLDHYLKHSSLSRTVSVKAPPQHVQAIGFAKVQASADPRSRSYLDIQLDLAPSSSNSKMGMEGRSDSFHHFPVSLSGVVSSVVGVGDEKPMITRFPVTKDTLPLPGPIVPGMKITVLCPRHITSPTVRVFMPYQVVYLGVPTTDVAIAGIPIVLASLVMSDLLS